MQEEDKQHACDPLRSGRGRGCTAAELAAAATAAARCASAAGERLAGSGGVAAAPFACSRSGEATASVPKARNACRFCFSSLLCAPQDSRRMLKYAGCQEHACRNSRQHDMHGSPSLHACSAHLVSAHCRHALPLSNITIDVLTL